MSLKRFPIRYPTGPNPTTYDFVQLQNDLYNFVNFIVSNKQFDSAILSDQTVTAGTNLIRHKLGRKIIGWYVIDTNAAVTLYRDYTSTEDLYTTLPLVADASATISLLVF